MKARVSFGWLAVVAVALVFWGGLGPVQADTLLYEYRLPVMNLNGSPGVDYPQRSNGSPPYSTYTTIPTDYSIEGDRFTLGHPGQQFKLTSVSLYMIWGNAVDQYSTTPINTTNFPSSKLTLIAGPQGDIAPRSTNPTFTRVWYTDQAGQKENFQRGNDGTWRGLWRIDFQLTDAIVAGGQNIDYFLGGLFLNGDGQYQAPNLLAANVFDGAVTRFPNTPADNAFLLYDMGTGAVSFAAPFLPNSRIGDAAIQLYGSEVPLPGAVWLLGSGLLGLLGVGRRLKRS